MPDADRMSDADYRQLLSLLRKFSDSELDQWANLIIPSRYGDVYVSLSRKPLVAELEPTYNRVPETWFDQPTT
ncbi:hypothetical protein [Nocardia aurantiaca]|uniref:Uncharacterized protein n=1 Tax=Nocardia aurantiaca TaxID=2675850 RepID=A0A6I3L8A4_9NOCA|nr:hypothetical protein [Nocardia aurantiaca]MTE16974.1 hypothetical protein [Nocardia aurantiaca]